MAIIARGKITEVIFITENDRESEDPTKFTLKPMDGVQYMGVMAEGNIDADGMMSFSERTMKSALRYGLVGWDNFNDGDGKKVKFSRLQFGQLPVEVLTEIFSEIISISTVDEDDSKN